jgi:hypothetical protein
MSSPYFMPAFCVNPKFLQKLQTIKARMLFKDNFAV